MQHTKFLWMLLTTLANRQTVKSHEFTTSHQADIDANTIHSNSSRVSEIHLSFYGNEVKRITAHHER